MIRAEENETHVEAYGRSGNRALESSLALACKFGFARLSTHTIGNTSTISRSCFLPRFSYSLPLGCKSVVCFHLNEAIFVGLFGNHPSSLRRNRSLIIIGGLSPRNIESARVAGARWIAKAHSRFGQKDHYAQR
jgi:hypothetical protein